MPRAGESLEVWAAALTEAFDRQRSNEADLRHDVFLEDEVWFVATFFNAPRAQALLSRISMSTTISLSFRAAVSAPSESRASTG